MKQQPRRIALLWETYLDLQYGKFDEAFHAGEIHDFKDLGSMYENGAGVEGNYAQAASWYRKAAEAGDPLGMTSLGWMYENGIGVEKDYAQAVSWYRKAAEAGEPLAMTGLGWMYE